MQSFEIEKISLEENGNLSEEQTLFNKLLKQIEKKKKELEKWDGYVNEHKAKYCKEFVPLEHKLQEYQKKLLLLFDQKLEDTKFTNGEKRKLKNLIHDMSLEILQERYDEEIEDIYNKYKRPEPKRKSIFEEMIGNFQERMEENFNQWKEGRIGDDEEENHFHEEKQEETVNEQKGKESIKEIYRKLAVLLHPDRETDPAEKERKTKVMQRLTKAYRDKNLTELLQIELEEAKTMVNSENICNKRVEGYNEVLKEELETLREKVYLSKRYFQVTFRGLKMSGLSKKKINHLFEEEVKYIEKVIYSAKRDLDKFINNAKDLKKFIKEIRMEKRIEQEEMIFVQ